MNVSIRDKNKPRSTTITTPSDDTPDIVLPLVILILFIVFVAWMLYLLISSGFSTSSPSNPVASDRRTTTTVTCAPGQCGTNLTTGIKTCPVGDVSLQINPAESVCNSRFVCDNPLTPFAVQSNGATDITGVCEPGVECPCLRVSQCPNFILSVFTTSNGNPYTGLIGQRITFPQETSYVTTNGAITDTPPIQFNDPSVVFCATPPTWLPISNPGCNFINASTPNSITYADLIICAGTISGCSGLTASPCLQGILAAISDNPDNLNQQNILTSQFGCVRGTPCPCGFLPVFDTNYGGVVCRQLPPV